jgi:hypothetical protein
MTWAVFEPAIPIFELPNAATVTGVIVVIRMSTTAMSTTTSEGWILTHSL